MLLAQELPHLQLLSCLQRWHHWPVCQPVLTPFPLHLWLFEQQAESRHSEASLHVLLHHLMVQWTNIRRLETPVIAAISFSSTCKVIPTAPNIVSTIVLSRSVTPHPIAYPYAASPTKDGVFSITQTICLPGKSFSSVEIVIPAAIDISNCGLWEKKIIF